MYTLAPRQPIIPRTDLRVPARAGRRAPVLARTDLRVPWRAGRRAPVLARTDLRVPVRQLGIWEDVAAIIMPPAERVVSDVTESVKDSVGEHGGAVVDQLLRSSQFKVVLDQLEDAAGKGVAEKVAENAPALIGFAVAGGAIGGAIFKGPIGVIAAGLIAAASGYKLVTSLAPPPPPPPPRKKRK